ncbi:hypothetical protein BsWGS_26637 [Bradybaena similaris]
MAEQEISLIHTDLICKENIPDLEVTAMQEFVNTDNKVLMRKCCCVESVPCKKHFSDLDVCCQCSVHSPTVELTVVAESVKTTDVKLASESSLEVENNAGDRISTKKLSLTFEVDVKNSTVITYDIGKGQKQNLQEAFLQFRQKKQDEARQQKQLEESRFRIPRTPARMEELRDKIIAQAKKYFGVPYAKKYWPSHAPEYSSPIFLDCCALVRRVMWDLQQELGFRLGPWNQAYMYDTLPVTLGKEQMRPGDLVFMSGVYVNTKSKRQLHNMVHVEIWLGEGDKTIGSRWNNGKVQVFDSYQFSPRSFSSEQYIFKSIDTWLMGVCRSYCPQHPWRLKKYKANSKSVFNVGDTRCDGKASDGSGNSLHVKSISLQDVNHLDTSMTAKLSNIVLEDDESNTALENDESNTALEDESNTALEDDELNIASEDVSNTGLEDDESNTSLEDESNTALEDDDSNTSLEDESDTSLEDESNTALKGELIIASEDESDNALDDDESSTALEYDESNIALEDESHTVLEDDESNIASEDESHTALEDDKSNTPLEEDESNTPLEDDELNITSEDESNTGLEDDESNTSLEDDESNTSLEDESNTAFEDDKSNTALEDGESNTALEDDKSNTALEDDESNTAWEDGESNAALEDDELNTALEDDESNTAWEDGESNAALEDDELNIALEDDELNTALEDDELNTALEDDELNTVLEHEEYKTACFDEALPAKTSPNSNNKACFYGTGSRYTFNSPKRWAFNRSSTIIPLKINTVHFNSKRDTEPINTVQCHDGQSIHTAKQQLDFETCVMKIRSSNQCLESTILPDFRINIFHNFAMDVPKEYLSKNMLNMVITNFKIDSETKSEGISVKLPKWSSEDEDTPNCWKTPMREAHVIQKAQVDSGIQKDNKIITWRESQPLSSITTNSINHFEPKETDWQGENNYVAKTTLITKAWPMQERKLMIEGGNKFIMDTCEDIGELKGNSCDKKKDDNSEMGYDASDCYKSIAKLSAKADDSLKKSSYHLDSNEVWYLNYFSEQDLTCIPTFCVNRINTLYRLQESHGWTSSLRCKSGDLSTVKELYKHITSRKSNARCLPRMRWLNKIWAFRVRYIMTNRHARSRRKVSGFSSRIRAKVRNQRPGIRGVFKTRLTSRMIGTTRNLSHNMSYGSKYMLRFLVNQCEWSRLVLSELPKNCDKSEAHKDQNGFDASTKQLVDLTLDNGRLSEVNTGWEFFTAIEQRMDALESVPTQLQKADTFRDPSISTTCDVYLGKLPSLEDGNVAPGVASAVLHSNKLLSNTKCDIRLHDLSFPLDKCSFSGTQHNACPDFKGIHTDQCMSDQVQQLSFQIERDSCGNMNNNSSKDWCSDLTDAGETDSDKMCPVEFTSEFESVSNMLPQNIHKHVQMRSDISMQRTMGSEPSEIHPSWLKDAHRNTTADTVYLSAHEKQRELALKAAEGVGRSANDPVRTQCPEAVNDTLEPASDKFQEIVDANRLVAQFVLNQVPKPADYTDSCDSGFQSHSKGIQSLSQTGCSHYCFANVPEDTVSICQLQDKYKDLDRVDNTECSRATSEDKTSGIRSGAKATGPQAVTEAQGNIDFDSYSFCSVDNLNEFSNAHPLRISDEFRHYLCQDTTSNDGGDDDDIDDNQMDEHDELKYYDAEKQTPRGLLQSFIRSHNGDINDDDENFDDFYRSIKESSDFSGTMCHADHKSSLFPGGGEQPQKFKISVGTEDDSQQEQGQSHIEQRGANGFLTVDIQVGGGAGDSCKDNEIEGTCRKDSRPYSLTQCCLPNNMQPTFFIGGANGIQLVEGPLLALGWRRTADRFDDRFKLKWVENKARINYLTFREGEQLVNHIPNCRLLTNKLGLLCSLQDYERITLITKGRLPRMKMADFVPETYKLDDKVDREKFIQEYKDGETWICKPTGMNQGKGIFLLRSKEKVDQLLGDRDPKLNPKCSRAPLMRIVQRYISHPLLINERKFDIRSYMFIASTVPFLVLYHKGYVRLSCNKYSPEDNNLTTHLTNQFVQKKDPAYKVVKEDTAWTMDKLNDYINEHVAPEKGLEQDWVYGKLTKQMQRITLHCFNSVRHKLQCKMGYFDLYGLDFMVDSDMKVWLIEINANPALHTNCQALKDAIPSVVEEAIYLALECFEKSCKGQPLMPLNSLGGYSVLYCGSSPNTASHRQIRSVSPFKDITIWTRSSGTTQLSRQAQSYSLPRIEPGNNLTSCNVHVPNSKKDKQVSIIKSTIINNGMTLEHETSTSDENNLNVQKMEYLSPHSQRRQRKPFKQRAQTDLLSDVKRKTETSCKSSVKTTGDNLFIRN